MMLEASRVRPPGVEEGASEAGGATGSRQGRRQERAKVEARAELLRTDGRSCCGRSCGHQRGARPELRTPAREIQRQAAGGCEREAESSGSWKCAVRLQLPLGHSLTHLLLTLMGQLKVGRIL